MDCQSGILLLIMIAIQDILSEVEFKASRSSGKGGQNVNKVSSKVELRFNIPGSDVLSEDQKGILLEKLGPRLTKRGELVITCSAERSQLTNKKKAVSRLESILEKALIPRKKRVPTKKTRTSDEKRLDSKKIRAEKKDARKRISGED
jgi:ribosome-associated protein